LTSSGLASDINARQKRQNLSRVFADHSGFCPEQKSRNGRRKLATEKWNSQNDDELFIGILAHVSPFWQRKLPITSTMGGVNTL